MRSNQALYRQLYRIRRFEETVLDKFPTGVFSGTTHTYLGQEANAVGVFHHLQDSDIVFSNHRGHGHFLTYGGDMRALFAELMGKSSYPGTIALSAQLKDDTSLVHESADYSKIVTVG